MDEWNSTLCRSINLTESFIGNYLLASDGRPSQCKPIERRDGKSGRSTGFACKSSRGSFNYQLCKQANFGLILCDMNKLKLIWAFLFCLKIVPNPWHFPKLLRMRGCHQSTLSALELCFHWSRETTNNLWALARSSTHATIRFLFPPFNPPLSLPLGLCKWSPVIGTGFDFLDDWLQLGSAPLKLNVARNQHAISWGRTKTEAKSNSGSVLIGR